MEPTPEPGFYLTRRGTSSGPFALEVLQRLVSAGEIAPDDRVRAQGARDWVRAADHPVLASELAARADLLAQLDGTPARFAVTLPPTSVPRLPKPGELVASKYRIAGRLGQGGMSEVFSAENVLTQRRVALKWLRPELAGDADARRRFSNEARLAARIRHPNVIDIYDVVEEEGPFLVMEQLDGEPLSSLLARKALSRVELLRVLLHAMEGVAAAHNQGVVHRDLKPDNVFVCTDAAGRSVTPKVLDFGISKAATPLREDSALTQIGALLGTPYYVPPEQLGHARHVDHRADVYALGVILYECLTGRLPYESTDLPTLLGLIHAGGAVSPRVHEPRIPEELAAIVRKAIAPRPFDRFASVEALQLALAPFVDEARWPAPMPQPAVGRTFEGSSLEPTMTYMRRPARKPRAVVGAALLGTAVGLIALVGGLRLLSSSAEAPRSSTTVAVPVAQAPDARAVEPVAVAAAPTPAAPPPTEPLANMPGATAAPRPLDGEPAASEATRALGELRRAARHCGQGEPSASVELRLDAAGTLSSLRTRGLEAPTVECLERAARPLAFGSSPAPRVLSLILPLRSTLSAGAAPATAGASAAASAATPAMSATPAAASRPFVPPPLVNPYHR